MNELASESRALKKQVLEICWYMRGSINIDQAWQLSLDDRSMIMDIIEQNIERTKESGIALL